MDAFLFALTASGGAVCQEVLYWYELRKKLNEKNRKILRSVFYWLITIFVIVVSGFGTYILFYDGVPVKLKIPFVLGAAFPYIFKKLVSVTQEQKLPNLGAGEKVTFQDVLKKYFQ